MIVAGVFGALIGSFLNVVAYRVPRHESIVRPPSACPSCGRRIRGYDNIPVLSWLVLGGRCRDCRERISVRYPLVELGTALGFAVVAAWVLHDPGWAADAATAARTILVLVALLLLVAVSIVLSLIDIAEKRLPDRIVLPTGAAALLLFALAALAAGDPLALVRAVVAAAAAGAGFALLAFASRGGLGRGDVKLALVLGLYLGWVGWGALVVGLFAAFVFGGLYGVVLLLGRRAGRRTAVPFAPWLFAGAWFGLAAGQTLGSAYLRVIGLA